MNARPAYPHNIEAEQALLGAILMNNDAYHRVNQIVRAEHFYEPIHRQIFEVVEKAAHVGKTVTPVMLKAYLPDENITEGVTVAQYLARLCTGATTVVNAPDYAQAVFDDAVRRRVMEIAQRAEADASKADIDHSPRDVIEETEKALYELAETGKTRGQVMGFNEALTEAINMVAAAYGRDGSLTGLATGLTDLDRLMGGLQASDLIVLAARPGMGKTSLATNIAFNVANSFLGNVGKDGVDTVNGGRVLFFSLEMSAEQLATRILSEQSGISSSDLRRGNIQESQYGDLVQTANRLSVAPLHIDDTGGQNIAQVAATSRRHKRNNGLDLVIVDYIQLLYGTTKKSGESRVQEITEITTKLKALAKELEVPIVALSQLSRAVETREDKHPQLSDLRESGSIEQDADVVLFVYREEYYLGNKEPKEGTQEHLEWAAEIEAAHGKAEIIIAKQRHGPTGIVNLHFDARLTRFSDPARDQYLPERRA